MASSGEGIPLDGINQGGKSQGEEGKITNKNKNNNKQKGTTSSNPRTDKPDEASLVHSDGKSVHPETSNAETVTEDAPNKAASTSSPEPNVDMNTSQHEDIVQKTVPDTSDSTAESDGDDEQGGDIGASLDAGAEMQSNDKNGGSGSTKDTINDEQQKMKAKIRRLKEEQAKMEKELKIEIQERDSDIKSYKQVIGEKEMEIQSAEKKIKDKDETIAGLKATSSQKDDEINQLNTKLEDFQVFTDKTSKNFQATVDEKNSLEIKVENLEKENKNLKSENKRMENEIKSIKKEAEQVEKQLKQKEKECKTLKSQNDNQMRTIKSYTDSLSKLRNEKEGTEKQLTKDYKKLKDDKEQTEKQLKKEIEDINKDRAKLNQTISQGTQQLNQYYTAYNKSVTEVSRLDADVQKLKLENHDLRTYKKDLEKQKEDLMLRLSKIAGANLTYNNPNIADLSDEKRPTKLAEEFSELYDNEWTDAFEEVEADDDKSRTKFLFDVLKRASEYCTDLSTGHDAAIKNSFTTLKYEVTVPVTEDSELVVDTTNDATETTTTDKVDKQEHDEDTPNGATGAVPTDNEDDQHHDKTNNDLSSDDKPQKDDKQENKEDDDVDDATDAESNEATNAMNATTDSSKKEVSPSENSEAQVGIEKDEDTPKDNCEDISKTEDEQGWRSVDTNEEEAGANAEAKEDVNEKTTKNEEESKSIKEPTTNDEAKDEKLLNSPDQTTSQETSDGVPTVEKSNGNDEEDTSSPKDEPTKPIDNTESKHDGENDNVLGTSVVGKDNDGNATSDGNNATNDTKFKDKEPDTNLPADEHAETVDDTNVDALGTSVDNESNSEPQNKDSTGAKANGNTGEAKLQDDGKETKSQLTADRDTNAANTPSGESYGNSTGTSSENKQPTTKTMEISKIDFNFEDLSNEQLKMIMDLKKVCEVQQSKDVKSNGAKIIAEAMGVTEESKEMWKYILKCIDICWSMHRHEPPVHINFISHVDGQPFEKNVYRPYTKAGKQLDFVVWPSLHLHKDGPMLSKGVAQGK